MEKLFGFVWLSLLLAIGGCAAPDPRTLSSDQTFKRVAVVSLLDEDSTLSNIGLTIFNNSATKISHDGQLNDLATKTIEASLTASRPGWELVSASTERPGLLDRRRSFSSIFVLGGMKADFAQLAQRLNVDAVFVLLPSRWDDTGQRGVGARMYSGPLRDTNSMHLYAMLTLSIVDRSGEGIAHRSGMNAQQETVPTGALGLGSAQSGAPAPDAIVAIKTALQRRLVESLKVALTSMGY
jgi:hypothetical protein